ncbi:hypothetical protein DFJ74DRAFT_684138 [Hyaloraphidium curvatum]|nr:hypothetical protein DFJ74DRAFT_684138 [Hyaloraphidium curvatum]
MDRDGAPSEASSGSAGSEQPLLDTGAGKGKDAPGGTEADAERGPPGDPAALELEEDDATPDAMAKDAEPRGFLARAWVGTRDFFYPPAKADPPALWRPLLAPYAAKLLAYYGRWPAWKRYLLLSLFYAAWAGTFVTITYFSTYHSQVVPNEGDDWIEPQWIGCYSALMYRNSGCGVGGQYCQPFSNVSYAFRCGPKCLLAKTQEDYWIGNDTVYKEPVVVGSGPYRGDSWLCMAGMHAGLVTDRSGGCMVVELVGEADSYVGSSRYGVDSESFPSQFPKSFVVRACREAPSCADLAWASLLASGIFAFFAATLTPSGSGTFFFSLVLSGFFWVVFGDYSSPRADSDFLSKAFAQLLPTVGVSYLVYHFVARTVLPQQVASAGLDVFIFYCLPWILGLDLVEVTTYMPDLTLNAKALKDPAQVAMLVACVVVIGAFAGYFLYWQRKLRRLPLLVLFYGAFFLFFFTVPLIFGLYPHLHHYMVALLLMPLTTDIQTRPSFMFQGFCLGWFLEGVGRWGFDTPAETRRSYVGAGLWNSARPSFANMSTNLWALDATLTWTFPADDGNVYTDLTTYEAQQGSGITSYSVLMNDFPIYQGRYANTSANTSYFDLAANGGTVPFFFRVAGVQGDGTVLDYSDVLTAYGNGTVVFPNGTWWSPTGGG